MPKDQARRARMTIRKAKVKIQSAKERKEKKVIRRAKVKEKTRKAKVRQRVTLVESQDI